MKQKQAERKRRQIQIAAAMLNLVTLAATVRLIGYNGVAYTAAAAEMFGLLWLLGCGAVSDCLGRLLRVRNAKGQYRSAARLRRNTLLVQGAFGLAGSVFLLAGADWLCGTLLKIPYSALLLRLLSPAVFLRSVSAVLQGYCQGEGTELPTAVACLLRQVFLLGLSLLFGRMLSAYGEKVSRLLAQENFTAMYGGAGVAAAVSVSELFVVIFLAALCRACKHNRQLPGQDGVRVPDSFWDSLRALSAARGPQWAAELLAFLPLPLGLVFLQKSGGGDAIAGYGVYGAGFWAPCGVLVCLFWILLLPVCGRAASCLRKEEQRFARSIFHGGVHYGVALGAFASVFLSVMAPQLAAALCPGQVQTAQRMLRGGGVTALFLLLSLYFGRMLFLLGGKLWVLGAVGAADVVYAVTLTVFLNAGGGGAAAIVYAGVLGLGVLSVLLGVTAYRQMRARPDWLRTAAIPVGVSAASGLLCLLLGRLCGAHLGEAVTLLISGAAGFVFYWGALLLLRNFKEQELEVLPGGGLLRAFGQLLGVFS